MSAAIPITRLDHTAAEPRGFAGRCGDGAQVRRLLALAMVPEGHSRVEAAEWNGMDRRTLGDWVPRHNKGGIDGLKPRHPPGAAPLLTGEQRAELKGLVVKSPDPGRGKVIRWRRLDLRGGLDRPPVPGAGARGHGGRMAAPVPPDPAAAEAMPPEDRPRGPGGL